MSGREADARQLFVEAEEAAADPTRIATALANYKTLLVDFSGTAFVARNRLLLGGRPNFGKEYYFLADSIRGAGSFILGKAGKMDSAWLSDRDSEAAAAAQNFVELSFTALPDLDYRLWIYAGGCCLETFSFSVQGTDMVLPGARATAANPGGSASIPLRPSLSLKKTHAMHTGPKSPARWDWIPVPLPKYGTPGLKVVRLLTDQQGFAVAYACVSALTSNAPRESEMKELEKSRSRRRVEILEKDIPGLVGHYRLDEGAGAAVNDASGKAGPGVIQGATWTVGHSGAALHFDGVNSWVDLPNTAPLDKLADASYSILAWFKPEDVPTGQGEQNNSAYGIVQRQGTTMGLSYYSTGYFSFMNWFYQKDDPSKFFLIAANSKPFLAGRFFHVAGILDRGTGRSSLYVNGKLESSEKFDAGARSMVNNAAPWRLGIGSPSSTSYRWCAKGVIDEARFYSRALTTAEVEAIYRLATPAPGAKAPADARPWRPVFDGKTMSAINPACFNGWKVKDGLLCNVTGVDNAAQTSEEFGDGELRIRLESRGNSTLWFIIRQVGPSGCRLDLTQLGDQMNKGDHEVIFTCRGASITATVDGKPARVDPVGTIPAKGVIQFNCNTEGALRIRSMEFRDPK
jgi:hypothetical protein